MLWFVQGAVAAGPVVAVVEQREAAFLLRVEEEAAAAVLSVGLQGWRS